MMDTFYNQGNGVDLSETLRSLTDKATKAKREYEASLRSSRLLLSRIQSSDPDMPDSFINPLAGPEPSSPPSRPSSPLSPSQGRSGLSSPSSTKTPVRAKSPSKNRARPKLPFTSLRPFSASKRARPYSARKELDSTKKWASSTANANTKSPLQPRWMKIDVDNYKWKALERRLDSVQLKYTDPKAYCGRAAFLPPVAESSTQAKEVMEMASLKVEIARRKFEQQAKQMFLALVEEMLEKNRQALKIPKEDKQAIAKLRARVLKHMEAQDPVEQCVAACCDDNMGSVVMFYRRVFDIYCRKPDFMTLLELVEKLAKKVQADVALNLRVQDMMNYPTFDVLHKQSRKFNNDFHKVCRKAVEQNHGRYLQGPVKTMESCKRKLETKYKGDHSRMVDIVRASGIFAQPSNVMRCIRALKSLKVVRVTDRLNNPTNMEYRDLKLNVRLQSGMVCELQLHMEGFYKKKEELHKFYQVERVKKTDKDDSGDKQKRGRTRKQKQTKKDKKLGEPVLVELGMEEKMKVSEKLVNARQALQNAEKVEAATRQAFKQGRKLSAADLVDLQKGLENEQQEMLEQAAKSSTFDPAAHYSGIAAKIAFEASAAAVQLSAGIRNYVELTRYILAYYASLRACRAAAVAAAVAHDAVNEMTRQWWIKVVNIDLSEDHKDMQVVRERLAGEHSKEVQRFEQRHRMGVLWKAGMAGSFIEDFSELTDDLAETYTYMVTKPLRDLCFRAWREWTWCSKLVEPRNPPPRVKPPASDSDTDDEDESEAFWAEHMQQLEIRRNAEVIEDEVLKSLRLDELSTLVLVQSYQQRKCQACRTIVHERIEEAKTLGLLLRPKEAFAMPEPCNHVITSIVVGGKHARKVSIADVKLFTHLIPTKTWILEDSPEEKKAKLALLKDNSDSDSDSAEDTSALTPTSHTRGLARRTPAGQTRSLNLPNEGEGWRPPSPSSAEAQRSPGIGVHSSRSPASGVRRLGSPKTVSRRLASPAGSVRRLASPNSGVRRLPDYQNMENSGY